MLPKHQGQWLGFANLPNVNGAVLVRDLHAQNPSKATTVCHFQLFLLCLRQVPSFTPIQEVRHNKCVKHLHFCAQLQVLVAPNTLKLGEGREPLSLECRHFCI
jgi:hypothetical protein